MPTITHPLVATPFVAGEVLDPDRVANGLYEPKSTPDNMSVMNGTLDDSNIAGPYTVDYSIVRPGAHAVAKSAGQTTNLDFFDDFFLGDYDATSTASNYPDVRDRALTAVGIKFYLPYACNLVYLSWHVGLVVDGRHLRTQTAGLKEDSVNISENAPSDPTGVLTTPTQWLSQDNTSLMLFVDEEAVEVVNRRIRTGKFSMCGSQYVDTASGDKIKSLSDGGASTSRPYWNNSIVPDHRWWSGAYVVSNLSKGWHTASIRVTNGKWEYATLTQADGSPRKKVAPQVRFKTCRFTAIPIR